MNSQYTIFEFYVGVRLGVLLLAVLLVVLDVASLVDTDRRDPGLLNVVYPHSMVADFRQMPANLRAGGVKQRTVFAAWTNEFLSFFALLSFTVALKFGSASLAKAVTGVQGMLVFGGIVLLERSGLQLDTDRDDAVTPKLDDRWQYLLILGVLLVLSISIYIVQCGFTGVQACAS